MLWELDEFQGPQFLGYVRNIPTPEAYIGGLILPDVTTFDLEFSYILGSDSRPVMANIIGWDSEAPIAGREPMGDRVQGELPPIKRKAKLSEKEIINRYLSPRANTPDQQTAIDEVYGLVDGLVDSVRARMEWLRWQALSQDTVVYDEDGVQFEFDYGLNNEYQIDMTTATDGDATDLTSEFAAAALTDHANSEPIQMMSYICDKVQEEKGFRPAVHWTSNRTVSHLLSNASVKTLVRGSGAPDAPLTLNELNIALDIHNLPPIRTYDATIREEQADGTYVTVRPLDQDKSVMLPGPEVTLGWTLWGPTAESRALVGTPYARQAPGIYATLYGMDEPPSEWAKAVGVGFPSLPGADHIVQFDLW